MVDVTDYPEPAQPTAEQEIFSRSALRHLLWGAGVAGAVLVLIWTYASGWMAPVMAIDLEQPRLNVSAPPASAVQPIVQTFSARHDGLNQVEILLARHGQEGQGNLTMRLLDVGGQSVASQTWPAAQLQHNQALVLRFPPQRNSAGREYRLMIEGEGGNPFGAWAYDLDVYRDGALLQAAGEDAGDLRFTTRYALTAPAALAQLRQMLAGDGVILLLSLLMLPLPGCLVLLAVRRRIPAMDAGAWWSVALALGLALWPLLWFWLTLAGGRWTRLVLAIFVFTGWLLVLALFVRVRRTLTPLHRHTATPLHIVLLLILLLALAVRLLAVRDLAFPPWVDSSRHGVITTIVTEEGQTPDDYSPYLPVDDFSYHFGFHTLAAGVQMLGEQPLPRTLLALGQLLNALAALGVYGGAWLLTRRRGAALLAAFLVAFPFFFPAYYVTWGRYTQLTGALLLAPLLALTWLLARGSRGWRRVWWLVGILAAGLFLVHVRVFLIYVPFVLLATVAASGRGSWLSAIGSLLAAGAFGLLLVAPRLWELVRMAAGSGYLSSSGSSYAAFPTGYVTTGWERHFLLMGGVAFVGLTVIAIHHLRASRRGSRALAGVTLGGWAGLVALLLSGRVPGVPVVWLINLNSAYILTFVPLSLLLALAFAHLWSWMESRRGGITGRAALLAVAVLLGAGIAAGGLFGARQQIAIVNESTILAQESDKAALAWVATHLAPEARLAVNSWRWLGQTWAAADGGAWLLPLTGRQTTTPPVDYIGDRDLFLEVISFNEQVTEIEDWSDPEAARWLADQGVSHVFVGARGGFFDPAELARNEGMEMVFEGDGVFVFRVEIG